jgi:hypothetical protein
MLVFRQIFVQRFALGTRTEWATVLLVASFVAFFSWIGISFVRYLWPSAMESEKERVRAIPAPARHAFLVGQVLLCFAFGLCSTFGPRVMHGALLLIFLMVVALWFAAVLTYRRLGSTAKATKS